MALFQGIECLYYNKNSEDEINPTSFLPRPKNISNDELT